MRRTSRRPAQELNLDSLVDIVSNIVGILVILSAFMGLITLLQPDRDPTGARQLSLRQIPKKILVPWSHPTTKNHLYLALRGNRIQFFDLRSFFLQLAEKKFSGTNAPVTIAQKGVDIRFFPVTNQIYCLEFQSGRGFGENWLQAQRPQSTWKKVLSEYPPEKYVLFFWVGGDSFELFRQIRKSLWERQYEVGWKPALKDDPLEICNGFEGSNTFRPQ